MRTTCRWRGGCTKPIVRGDFCAEHGAQYVREMEVMSEHHAERARARAAALDKVARLAAVAREVQAQAAAKLAERDAAIREASDEFSLFGAGPKITGRDLAAAAGVSRTIINRIIVPKRPRGRTLPPETVAEIAAQDARPERRR